MRKILLFLLLLMASFPVKELHGETEFFTFHSTLGELSFSALCSAITGYTSLNAQNKLSNDSVLTIIDYSLPSYKERLFVIDPVTFKVLDKSLVAHGINSGSVIAKSFTNARHSHKSSLGFYITGETYSGKHGYSLRLHGMEPGINSNAFDRAIVMHGADYVSQHYLSSNGRLGRSFGCPAIPKDKTGELIDKIKSGACLFIYAPDKNYFSRSALMTTN